MTVDKPTVFRVNGDLTEIEGLSDIPVNNRLILSLLNADQEEKLNAGNDVEFVIELSDGNRQRVNVYRQMGRLACAIRLLNSVIPTLEELNLPVILNDLATKKSGLILVTGTSGSGKTTTLSIILNHINHNRPCHIITLEDPVEYRYEPETATIHQREIGSDVKDFQTALKHTLREDPDVILVGEMRDYETMQLTITAAETGHFVLATLHTRGAIHTVNRIVDACPPNIQHQILVQLSQILEAIISQQLLPLKNGKGRVAALEVMIGNDAVKNMIRSNKCHQLETALQQGKSAGMCTMDDAIIDLYRQDLITRETAMAFAYDRLNMATKF
jgi:twitching motility protein PilT